MWSQNLPDLAKQRTVYSIDAIGDAGQSVQTRPIATAEDQATWIDETLAALDLPKVHLIGHSFGGWTAANYATHFPARLSTLSLLEPVFVFGGLRWQMYVKSIPASIPFFPASWRKAMLESIGGTDDIDPNDPTAAMIDAGLTGYAAKLPTPQQITTEQLSGLDVPTYVALGGMSAMKKTMPKPLQPWRVRPCATGSYDFGRRRPTHCPWKSPAISTVNSCDSCRTTTTELGSAARPCRKA